MLLVFSRKSALNKHTTIHSGIKTHICPDCGNGFYFPYELKRHCKIHDKKNIQYQLEPHQQTVKQSIHNNNDTSEFLQDQVINYLLTIKSCVRSYFKHIFNIFE